MSPITGLAPRQAPFEQSQWDVVGQIALKMIAEVGMTLLCGTLIAFFLPTQASLTVIAEAALIQFVVSGFFHAASAFVAPQLCQWMTGTCFGYLTGFNVRALIHEAGHALATLAVYENPRPLISLTPFREGLTQFYKTALSPFGKLIGPVGSTFLVTASGALFALAISSAILAIGIALRQEYPHLSKYLIMWSLLDFAHHAFYAYEALFMEKVSLRHDFAHLTIFGIHPLAAMTGIIAIPVVIALGMLYNESRTQSES
jgi:hypothetical protein